MKVVLWGTYDLGKPRTRILREGLKEIGVEVIEIHSNVWEGLEDKSQINRQSKLGVIWKVATSYPSLILRYLRAPRHDAVLVPYLGQLDVLILWPFARLRGRAIILDLFLSLYDTVVNDRKMASPRSLKGRALKAWEWLACRAADLVLLDTPAHARHVDQLFSLPPGKTDAIPVGVEPGAFPRLPPRPPLEGRIRILFYGQLIPLHGIRTILDAALSDEGRQHDWHLIGTGQDREVVAEALSAPDAGHIRWDDWVEYEDLIEAIAGADICLGIFGDSQKAASVVPNKVFQTLAAGRSIITRDSAAMREFLPGPPPGLTLIPHSDPKALIEAIDEVANCGFPVVDPSLISFTNPPEIATSLRSKILKVIEGE
ncbi:glycosyltransferase [Rhodobacteraceae bacterium NNCM2]|nr:glycosyltransferase [Coraliihabitans acroporae]